MITRVSVMLSLVVAHFAAGQHPTTAPSATPGQQHGVVLYRVHDSVGHVALVDNRAFSTVAGLKQYIESLPSGDRVSWFLFYDPSPENPFTAGRNEIQALCKKKGIRFHLYYE